MATDTLHLVHLAYDGVRDAPIWLRPPVHAHACPCTRGRMDMVSACREPEHYATVSEAHAKLLRIVVGASR